VLHDFAFAADSDRRRSSICPTAFRWRTSSACRFTALEMASSKVSASAGFCNTSCAPCFIACTLIGTSQCAGQEDHRLRDVVFAQPCVQFHAAHAVHADVEHDAADAIQPRARYEVARGVECLGFPPCRTQEPADAVADARVVVDQQDRRPRSCPCHSPRHSLLRWIIAVNVETLSAPFVGQAWAQGPMAQCEKRPTLHDDVGAGTGDVRAPPRLEVPMIRAHYVAALPAVLLVFGVPFAACAQDADALAKQLSNPISSLTSVPLQLNWDTGYGDRRRRPLPAQRAAGDPGLDQRRLEHDLAHHRADRQPGRRACRERARSSDWATPRRVCSFRRRP
jgi:hypothetical protein